MVVWTKGSERRKHQRIPMKTGVFAVIGSQSNQKCIVVDISMGGLSFRYYEGADNIIKEVGDDTSGKMEITAVGKDFNLGNIPFKSIYDRELDKTIPYGPLKARKRGVVFGRLTQVQKSKLEGFIGNHLS